MSAAGELMPMPEWPIENRKDEEKQPKRPPGQAMTSLNSEYPHIPLNDRVKVSQNWSHGICRKEVMLKWRINLLPWIHLDGDVLYLSQAADIGVYYLRPDRERLQRSPLALFSGHQEDEEWVPCRVIKQDVNCLDCIGGLIVSGSRDRTARIWTLSSNCPRGTIPMNDKVWSVAISPTQSSFVTGIACCENFSPLRIWDVERLSAGSGTVASEPDRSDVERCSRPPPAHRASPEGQL
ncbi:hypothetical protein J4Q44_G00007480 [Coregonus suidteri]|uniref:Uncharacterized protein n=1 Tax=Coregonus suidteri TaxID=861788 RepID=A0AAN8MDD2_9TELE